MGSGLTGSNENAEIKLYFWSNKIYPSEIWYEGTPMKIYFKVLFLLHYM